MLLPEDAPAKRLCGVAVSNGDFRLNHDGTVVELRGDEVHGAAVSLHACVERPLVRIEPRECWKQRWMNVEQPTGVALDELRCEDAHESSQCHQPRRKKIDFACKR